MQKLARQNTFEDSQSPNKRLKQPQQDKAVVL
jgi:hypothetical protein